MSFFGRWAARGWTRWQVLYGILDTLDHKLNLVLIKVEKLMASEQELQADLDAIKTGVAAVATKLAGQAQQIADLQAQLAAGTPVSQAQLDSLKAEADDIVTALQPLTT